jgi:ribose transport system substrate-binding protein
MDRKFAKVFAGGAAVALALSSVGTVLAQDESAAPEESMAAAGGDYVIGFSNPGGVGNGWREEMICAAKAQALASGQVASMNIIHRDTDPAGQLEDVRNLIAAGVNAIVLNPSDPEALNSAIAEATGAGIPVVSIDAPVSEPSAYNLSNDQETYGRLGAEWLFEKLGGAGDVFYMRGIAGHPADTARDVGFKAALENYPDINIVQEVFTDWAQDTGKQQMLDMISSGQNVDGVWTSGIDNIIAEAYQESGQPLVPVVGADNAGFVSQLLTIDGFEGAAVTNPGTVGGAGVKLALQLLNGEGPEGNTVTVDPVLMANDSDEGLAMLEAAQNPNLSATWPVGLQIPGWTDYTDDQLIACVGPGE